MNVKEYYLKPIIKYQLGQLCRNREVFFKGFNHNIHVRPVCIYSMDGVDYEVKRHFDKQYHFFASVAKIDFGRYGKPPTKLEELAKFRKKFHQEYKKFVIGYDFVLDIDYSNGTIEENIKNSQEVAGKIKTIFDKYYLPYSLIFSGNKGFHFRINWEDLPFSNPLVFLEKTKKIAQNIAHSVGYLFGDTIDNIYDLKRVIRVPYSIHPKTNCVVLPLTDRQFEFFDYKEMDYNNVMNTVRLKNRGLLKRQFEKPPAFDKFFKAFG